MGKEKCAACKGSGYGDIAGGLELPVLCFVCDGTGNLGDSEDDGPTSTTENEGPDRTCLGCGGKVPWDHPCLLGRYGVYCYPCEEKWAVAKGYPATDPVGHPVVLPGLVYQIPEVEFQEAKGKSQHEFIRDLIEPLERRIAELITERDAYDQRRRAAMESNENWRDVALDTKARLIKFCEIVGAHWICEPRSNVYDADIHAQVEYILGIGEFADSGFFGGKS